MTAFILIDGRSRLVIERDPDGRARIAVHDREHPGYAVTCTQADADKAAAFLRGES
ncbi:hypothetical protein IU469_22085 [Nocardia puris]|uniref:hypothetical protein n=1 Tax=Nocardia puris TaxID=208602 RepID=UPI001894597B|nr:hypothetical protein [Nocardia puris]MBF6368389.1 hypothetical protein [Nocardia puris]